MQRSILGIDFGLKYRQQRVSTIPAEAGTVETIPARKGVARPIRGRRIHHPFAKTHSPFSVILTKARLRRGLTDCNAHTG